LWRRCGLLSPPQRDDVGRLDREGAGAVLADQAAAAGGPDQLALDGGHRVAATFGDADLIAPYNPLRRVPTLVLDDGGVLIESGAILDYLDDLVGPSRALIAESGEEARRRALKVCALATALADKGGHPVLRALKRTRSRKPPRGSNCVTLVSIETCNLLRLLASAHDASFRAIAVASPASIP
jgi:glutathione S-transferase